MPAIEQLVRRGAELANTLSLAERSMGQMVHNLIARVNIPSNQTSPPGLIEANTRDPFKKSGKYALIWVYFGVFVLVCATTLHFFHALTDRIRTALHEDEVHKSSVNSSPVTEYEMSTLQTDKSTHKLFPRTEEQQMETSTHRTVTAFWAFRPMHLFIAAFRYVFYRPIPDIRLRKGWRPISFPPLSVLAIAFLALAMSALYSFLPQPLYWQSIQYGAPPLTVRSGMMAVAMMPWIVATSMKANIISVMTGIGHERLNVFHRWGSYICLFLSLVHAVPFWFQANWDPAGFAVYQTYFKTPKGLYFFGSGIAALVPLGFLCIHSLPMIRRKMYELFVALHVPVAMVFLGMLFWHCNNYLTSWQYLAAAAGIWVTSYMARVFFLNWAKPSRMSWLIGDDASVTILPENAIKITIPTQVKWKPGQYVYLRMPGVSILENHPFTIASLCSDDLPSEYGDEYRDMVLVFRPFGGFTKRVLTQAINRGPWHTYRAFVDGPYGGLRRKLESFDQVVLVAGGSGITALTSHLLDLIKRMRDGKAITRNINVIWAMRRPETMEWFKEELRICRECAPPESVKCQFFITAAKRMQPRTFRMTAQTTQQHISSYFRDHINDAFQGLADKRSSYVSKRNSALIREEADGDEEREKELRFENEDTLSALPRAHLMPENNVPSESIPNFSHPMFEPLPGESHKDGGRNLSLDIETALQAGMGGDLLDPSLSGDTENFNFGFPSTPTEFQKNLMRFAFLPAATRSNDGWSTEYGRPDLPYMLRDLSDSFEPRTCIFVCGPPSMRVAVSNTVADLQRLVLGKNGIEEIYLHTENYAL